MFFINFDIANLEYPKQEIILFSCLSIYLLIFY